MMHIDLTPVFQAIITLLAAIVTYKLIPWLKSRATAEQQQAMFAMVNVLVYAAEQLYGAGHGADKLSFVTEQLESRGFTVDLEAIEAMVRQLSLAQPNGKTE